MQIVLAEAHKTLNLRTRARQTGVDVADAAGAASAQHRGVKDIFGAHSSAASGTVATGDSTARQVDSTSVVSTAGSAALLPPPRVDADHTTLATFITTLLTTLCCRS